MERRKCDVTALAAWTCSHFAVDFGCFVILFGMMKPVTGDLMMTTTAFLAYNILAFGLQPFMGQLCDEKAWWRSIAGPGGCALVVLGLGLAAAVWMAGYTDRAFAGSILPLSWNRGGFMILLPAAAACLGKALGGLPYWPVVALLETAFFAAEAWVYRLLCDFTIRRALVVSLVLNGLSFGAGLLVQ